MSTSGVATGASLSADAMRIAWTNDQGLKVAGTPATAEDPCVLSSPPVVISPSASEGAIGGADVTAFLSKSAQPPTVGPPPPVGGRPTGGAKPEVTVPKRVTTKALASAKGVPIKVKVSGPGKITISGSAPARILSRSGGPVVVATGSATARRAETVTVRLRLTAPARQKQNRLKGARMTLRVSHGGLSITKGITLR